MPTRHTISFVRIDSIDGQLTFHTLYQTEKAEWADRLTSHISQDWEGTKEVEKARNARGVVITSVDEVEHRAACARIDGRRNGTSARPVVMGQEFATVTACAERLGVTAAAISKELNKTSRRPYELGKFASVKIRGATIAYKDEYELALTQAATGN